MTTGEYLLSKSSLNSGTALAHLLALQTGTGQGTVFASMFSVSVAQPTVTVSSRDSHSELYSEPVARMVSSLAEPVSAELLDAVPSLFIYERDQSLFTFTEQHQVVVTTGASASILQMSLDKAVVYLL